MLIVLLLKQNFEGSIFMNLHLLQLIISFQHCNVLLENVISRGFYRVICTLRFSQIYYHVRQCRVSYSISFTGNHFRSLVSQKIWKFKYYIFHTLIWLSLLLGIINLLHINVFNIIRFLGFFFFCFVVIKEISILYRC